MKKLFSISVLLVAVIFIVSSCGKKSTIHIKANNAVPSGLRIFNWKVTIPIEYSGEQEIQLQLVIM